jgi:hypothetical protein
MYADSAMSCRHRWPPLCRCRLQPTCHAAHRRRRYPPCSGRCARGSLHGACHSSTGVALPIILVNLEAPDRSGFALRQTRRPLALNCDLLGLMGSSGLRREPIMSKVEKSDPPNLFRRAPWDQPGSRLFSPLSNFPHILGPGEGGIDSRDVLACFSVVFLSYRLRPLCGKQLGYKTKVRRIRYS